MVKTKRAGFMTKIIVLVLLIYLATSLLDQSARLNTAKQQLTDLQYEVSVQTQKNAELSDALEHSDDPAVLERVAREKGYVREGERIMVDVAN